MIRNLIFGTASAAALSAASGVLAEQYVDYTPGRGVWEINAVDVDPNHIDDYLVGLRKSQVPSFEIMKRHGIIDDYKFMVRNGYGKGNPSVLIMTHYTSAAMLEPDKARDQMIEKEILAQFSKEAGDKAVAGYEKYRSFVDDSYWSEVTMMK